MNVEIKELYDSFSSYECRQITVSGWVRTNRDSKNFGFIELSDGTCFKTLQVVYEAKKLENYRDIASLTVSAGVEFTGKLIATPNAAQPFELHADMAVIRALSDRDYPLQKKRHSLEFLRDISHLRPRSNTFSAVFRVRSIAAYAIHRFFQERGFVYVNTPILTASDAEGAGEMFQVTTLDMNDLSYCQDGSIDMSKDFFGRRASLAVSGQLEAEAYALAFRKVYTFGPTFRAENSNTARHAAEFWMIEPEIAFADVNDGMCAAEDMIKYVINYVLEHAADEFEFFDKRISDGITDRMKGIVESDFGHVTYTEAIDILEKSDRKFEFPVEWGIDLQTEHERYLTDDVFGKPVFVTDYPRDIKAFYMRLNDDGRTVAAFDMLVPGIGELIGGSQREERIEVLRVRMAEMGMDENDYGWYMDLRRYGGVRHAGFGLGFERLIMYMTGMSNIRDVIPFPRTAGSMKF